ncbi:Cas8a1 family CRISPR/Cas system-associated protein [Planococcus kocurii]|uniref:Cas8a1 family CRISPR/Cas system-associated protein n=1 Tax=Planococcus kocurii TaxID=1374 RepID=UPI003AAA9B52
MAGGSVYRRHLGLRISRHRHRSFFWHGFQPLNTNCPICEFCILFVLLDIRLF